MNYEQVVKRAETNLTTDSGPLFYTIVCGKADDGSFSVTGEKR